MPTLQNDSSIIYQPSNVGAAIISKIASTASTNATSVKTSPGRVLGWVLCNTSATIKFFRLYNKASAPTVGTDSPAVIIAIPALTTLIKTLEGGSGYNTGIAYAITGAVADLDTTVTAANDVIGAVYYA